MSESEYLISKAIRMPKIAMPGAKKKAAAKAQKEAGMKAFNDFMGTPRPYVSPVPPRVVIPERAKPIAPRPKPPARRMKVGTEREYQQAGIQRNPYGF
jgi:hypothetical protein